MKRNPPTFQSLSPATTSYEDANKESDEWYWVRNEEGDTRGPYSASAMYSWYSTPSTHQSLSHLQLSSDGTHFMPFQEFIVHRGNARNPFAPNGFTLVRSAGDFNKELEELKSLTATIEAQTADLKLETAAVLENCQAILGDMFVPVEQVRRREDRRRHDPGFCECDLVLDVSRHGNRSNNQLRYGRLNDLFTDTGNQSPHSHCSSSSMDPNEQLPPDYEEILPSTASLPTPTVPPPSYEESEGHELVKKLEKM